MATNEKAGVTVAESQKATRCANCGASGTGRFCSECGEPRDASGNLYLLVADSFLPTDATGNGTDLLLRISNDDPAAWDEILRRYGKLVSTTVRSFRLQEADARDAIQMTWLRLAENAHKVRIPERLGGWLATTARRECLRILREAKRGPHLTGMAPETLADPSADPEQHIINADTAQTLWRLVAELPPRRRTLLRALFTENPRSYDTIARLTGIPAGGIGPTRARALRQLRDKLDKHEMRPGA